jgi:hypothetical protein
MWTVPPNPWIVGGSITICSVFSARTAGEARTDERVGAKNSVRDLHVLVFQAMEAVSSQWPGDGAGGPGWPAVGCWVE